MKSFILPAGMWLLAPRMYSLCMPPCWKVDRNMQEQDLFVDERVIKYLNRLSDYLSAFAIPVTCFKAAETLEAAGIMSDQLFCNGEFDKRCGILYVIFRDHIFPVWIDGAFASRNNISAIWGLVSPSAIFSNISFSRLVSDGNNGFSGCRNNTVADLLKYSLSLPPFVWLVISVVPHPSVHTRPPLLPRILRIIAGWLLMLSHDVYLQDDAFAVHNSMPLVSGRLISMMITSGKMTWVLQQCMAIGKLPAQTISFVSNSIMDLIPL